MTRYHVMILLMLSVVNFNFSPGKVQIVFLISEDENNYEAHKTIPAFAKKIASESNYEVRVLLGRGDFGAFSYPEFGNSISSADLVVLFTRRVALPHSQMNLLKLYLKKGNPLIGIRTANHAFNVREEIQEGFEDWASFPENILGCANRGYGPVEPGTDISIVNSAADHKILKGLPPRWHSKGNVYLVSPLLDTSAVVLLNGEGGEYKEPIAWTRKAGSSKVFYTSLGHPSDFSTDEFLSLLSNSIHWALSKEN